MAVVLVEVVDLSYCESGELPDLNATNCEGGWPL